MEILPPGFDYPGKYTLGFLEHEMKIGGNHVFFWDNYGLLFEKADS